MHSDDYVSGGTPIVNPANLDGGCIVPNQNWTVDAETLDRLSQHRLQAGDIVFARRGELGRCALVTAKEHGWLCGTGAILMRPRAAVVHSEYLNRVIATPEVADWLRLESVGATMENLSTQILSRLPLPIPQLDEQCRIASFLDRETAKIDALIEKKERLIALLEEKRAALINRAVTRGIDPNAPTRDSGIPSIGPMPAHWQILRNKRLFHEADDRSVSGEEELLSVSHLTGVTPRAEKDVSMFMAESMEGYKLCRKGDLIVNTMWAYMGRWAFPA